MVISVEPVVNNCCKKCLGNRLRILKTYIKDRTIIDDSVIKFLLNMEELMDPIGYLIRQNMAYYNGRRPIAFKRTINKKENFIAYFFMWRIAIHILARYYMYRSALSRCYKLRIARNIINDALFQELGMFVFKIIFHHKHLSL